METEMKEAEWKDAMKLVAERMSLEIICCEILLDNCIRLPAKAFASHRLSSEY